jgi:hypothetical protein
LRVWKHYLRPNKKTHCRSVGVQNPVEARESASKPCKDVDHLLDEPLKRKS